jgi:two-component system phosphate regulon sensor histidine kinase PhoR
MTSPHHERSATTFSYLPGQATEYSPLATLALDRAGAVCYANPAALQLLQAAPQWLQGRPFGELLEPGSRAKGRDLLSAAAAGPTGAFELYMLVGGESLLVSWQACPLPRDEEPPLTLLYGQPQHKLVAATERLLALNQRLSAMFGVAAAASASLELDDMLQRVLRTTLQELHLRIGAVLLADTPSPSGSDTDAHLRVAAQQHCPEALLERLSDPRRAAERWDAQQLPDGGFLVLNDALELELDELPLQSGPLLSLVALPLIHEQQRFGWLYLLSDRYQGFGPADLEILRAIINLLGPPLTNARLHTALRETGSQLQAVFDSIDSGVLLVDQSGVVRYTNARLGVLLEADVAGWIGRPHADVLRPTLPADGQFVEELGGDLWELEDPPRVLRRVTNVVYDRRGAPLGTVEIYSDITAIQHMNRLKDEFVAAAAHDLKTPVTAVKGYAQIALRLARRLGDEKLVQQLAMINARSDDLTHLMESLLDVSRIQAGRLRLDLSATTLGGLAEAVQQHFEFDLRRQSRSLLLEIAEPGTVVCWDRQRIIRALSNLVGNALKYSPEGGPVVLRADLLRQFDGTEVLFSITDSGIGIPPEERERVFERFYRVPQTVAYGFKGTGLGLYICRYVVEAHHGRIWIADARHHGPGTTVCVQLPQQVQDE